VKADLLAQAERVAALQAEAYIENVSELTWDELKLSVEAVEALSAEGTK